MRDRRKPPFGIPRYLKVLLIAYLVTGCYVAIVLWEQWT